MLPIHIPSRGRHNEILTKGTLSQLALCQGALQFVTVWCAFEEVEAYTRALAKTTVRVQGIKLSTVGADGMGHNELSDIHQKIYEHDDGPGFILADDDLRFARRELVEGPTLRRCGGGDMELLLTTMEINLKASPMVSITPRQGNNRQGPVPLTTGPTRSWIAYHRPTLQRIGVRFDRTISKNDYDVALQVYRASYPARISTFFTSDQALGGSATGGSMITRTPLRHQLASYQLKALHPDFVDVVIKDPPSWGPEWKDGRTDVRIQWKAAFESGRL